MAQDGGVASAECAQICSAHLLLLHPIRLASRGRQPIRLASRGRVIDRVIFFFFILLASRFHEQLAHASQPQSRARPS
jgi:hypothetical protein